jgi:hypothetical protein
MVIEGYKVSERGTGLEIYWQFTVRNSIPHIIGHSYNYVEQTKIQTQKAYTLDNIFKK